MLTRADTVILTFDLKTSRPVTQTECWY